ncbi:MAG: 4'-phosphopantetheinyl transferase [Epulopiscium sp. Nele67-Bin002]|nr:MAG: holo-[acyl-carrier-protein] synthase [Epulopiscium sp. Nuni2H_MBin001]OON91352.1 MAG: 4'-phosphopantetheinyl transferase [Epulopiscium sp. Nele67-Bin002]OON91871.1 MAG: holo-[acyl-carrier-protein] synthase [Epulopiscium sp. Nele67-Bin001]
MIEGIGTDIIEIERIKRAVENNEAFLDKIFTDYERSYFKQRNFNAQSIAGIFAAKEAVSKALGTGFRGIRMNEIEIRHTEYGKPLINLYGSAKELASLLCVNNMQISISHCKLYAVAFVIAEK